MANINSTTNSSIEVQSLYNANSKLILFTIILVFTYSQIATDLYLPSLVHIADSLKTNTNLAQLTITAYIISMMITQPIYGIASDAFGRKKILFIGATITTIGTFMCLLASSIYILLLGRFIQGLGAGSGVTVCRAIMRDLFSGVDFIRTSSYLVIFGMTFMITAPILGGYLEYYFNWRASFFVLLILCSVVLFNLKFILPETNVNKHKDHFKFKYIITNFTILLKSNKFILYTLCSTIAYANMFVWITAAPVLIQNHYGLSSIDFGWSYCIAGLFYVAGNLFNRSLVNKLHPNKLILFGFCIQLICGLSLLFLNVYNLDSAYTIIVAMSTMLLGTSFVFPNSNSGALNDFLKISGTASALFSIIQTAGAVVSSAYIAIMPSNSLVPLSLWLNVTCSLALILSMMISLWEKRSILEKN